MTQLKDCGSFPGAMEKAMEQLTVEGCKNAINRSKSQIYNFADEASGQHPTLEQAFALDVACAVEGGEPPFFEVYSRKLKHATQHFSAARPASYEEIVGNINAEVGLLNVHFRDMVSTFGEGGTALTPNEKKRARQQTIKAIRQLEEFYAHLAPAPSGKRRR